MIAYFTLVHTEILRLPECSKLDGMFSEIHRNQKLEGSVIHSFKNVSMRGCISYCLKFTKCKSLNFLDYAAENSQPTGTCELNSEECDSISKTKLRYEDKATYIQTPKAQLNVSYLIV